MKNKNKNTHLFQLELSMLRKEKSTPGRKGLQLNTGLKGKSIT